MWDVTSSGCFFWCFTRSPDKDGNPDSSRDAFSAGDSDCEAERLAKNVFDWAWVQHNGINLINPQRLRRLTLKDQPPMCSFNIVEACSAGGLLLFEFLEQERPHNRQPLYDKASPFIWYSCIGLSIHPSFFILTWVLVGSYSARPHPHQQVSNLSSQICGCTGVVIFWLQVGCLLLGMLFFPFT